MEFGKTVVFVWLVGFCSVFMGRRKVIPPHCSLFSDQTFLGRLLWTDKESPP